MLCERRIWSFRRNGSMRSITGIDRRRFLLASAAPLALIGQAKRQRAAAISPLEFKKRLRGPILSAPTVYNADYAIDHQGTRRMVECAASAGVSVFTLTRGNNQYDQLTYEEIKALTRTMADATRGRG